MSHVRFIIPALALSAGINSSCDSKQERENENPKPNIIYILADDLGYGDLGSYGQEKIHTPNLDRMASEGMRFTRHYSGSTVCAPSRSSLLTGLHTGHTYIRGNREVKPEGQHPLHAEAFTFAEAMKEAGYVTGAFGKWGLGMAGTEGGPNEQGFDQFFGFLCQRYAHRYYPTYLWENDRKYPLEGNDWDQTVTYAPDVIHEKTLDFIRNHADTSFFLYVPAIIPHAEILAPEDSLLDIYKGKFGEEPHQGNDYGADDFKIPGYASQEIPHAVFAAMVTRLDRQVGQIIDLIEDLGLTDNTIIMFTSDNGPHLEGGADPDFFDSNGPLKGYKRDLYEGGIRVPFIVKWPGKVRAGSVSDHISAFWDIFPTLSDIAGAPGPEKTDGISFVPELIGQGEQPEHSFLYWEFHERNGRAAVLSGDWKLIRYNVLNQDEISLELYNLADDPGEENNIAESHPEKVKELHEIMIREHQPSEVFQFDPVYLEEWN